MNKKFATKLISLCLVMSSFFVSGTACSFNWGKEEPSSGSSQTIKFLEFTNDSLTLNCYEEKVLGMNTNVENISFTSADENVVTITQEGVITAWSVGTTTVTVSGDGISDTCTIVVERGNIVPFLEIEDSEVGLLIGDTYTITPKLWCNEKEYSDASFTFTTNNEEVASVNSDGVIQARLEGEAIITVVGNWRFEDSKHLTEQIVVRVNKNIGLSINEESFDMYATDSFGGQTFTNTANATYKLVKVNDEYDETAGTISWQVQDDEIATVDDDGKITANKAGVTKVRAVYTNQSEIVYSLWVDVNVRHAVVELDNSYTVDLWERELPDNLKAFMTEKSLNTVTLTGTNKPILAGETLSDKLEIGEQYWNIVNDVAGYTVEVLAVSKIITTCEEFLYMHQYIQTHIGGMYDGYLVLGNDIDFTGFKGYKTGYGTGISTTIYDPYFSDGNGSLSWYTLEDCTGFNGIFDGQGHKVIGGRFANYGLFHKLTSSAIVENIGFIDCDLASSNESTTVARVNNGTIRNVFVTVSNPCTRTTSAGITINNKGTVENCVVYYKGVSAIAEGGAATTKTTNSLKNVYTVTEAQAINGEKTFATVEELYQAWRGANTVDVSGFNANYWDLENYMIPVFKGYDGSIKFDKKLTVDVGCKVLYAGENTEIITNVPNITLKIEGIADEYAGYVTLKDGKLTVANGVESVMTEDSFTFTLKASFDGLTDSEQVTVEKKKSVIKLGGEVEVETKADNELLISTLVDTSKITKIRIGDVEIKGYTIAGNKLTMKASTLTNVTEYGENKLQLITDTAIYEQPLFVISKLITNSDDFLKYMDDYLRTDVEGKYDGYVALGADLDFSSYTSNWYPGTDGLGWGASIYNNDETVDNTFAGVDKYEGFFGTLDGRGHTVKSMRFAKGGLFYKIGETGVVKNISFVDCDLALSTSSGAGYTVPIARYNRGTIDNVFITVTKFINYGDNYAGIVHTNYGTISNSVVYYMGYVAGTGSVAYTNSGKVENVYSVTNVLYHVNGVCFETAEAFYQAWKVDGEVDTTGFVEEYWDFDDYLIPVFKGFSGFVGETNLKNALELTASKKVLHAGDVVSVVVNVENATLEIDGLESAYVSYVTLQNGVLTLSKELNNAMTEDSFTFVVVAKSGSLQDSVTFTVEKTLPKEIVAGQAQIETKSDNVLTIPAELNDASEIEKVYVSGVEVTGFAVENNTLKLPLTALAGISVYGETTLEYVTATKIYSQSALVVSKVIRTNDEFLNMHQYLQTSIVGRYDGYIVLGADLNFSSYNQNWYQGCDLLGWAMSIHNYDANTTNTDDAVLKAYDGFVGTFDGMGHSIKGMRFARGGIFYKIGEGGVVKNIAFVDCNFDVYTTKTDAYISTLAYHNYGEINNVFVTVAKINASKYRYSGLVGINYKSGKILNSVVYFKPSNADSGLTDSYQVAAVSQWNNYGGTVANVYAITESRFISSFNKDFVVGYDTYAKYLQSNVQATKFKDIAYADSLFKAFNASASALEN